MVDTSDVFNSSNRNVFLHKVAIICPTIEGMFECDFMPILDYLLLIVEKQNQLKKEVKMIPQQWGYT